MYTCLNPKTFFLRLVSCKVTYLQWVYPSLNIALLAHVIGCSFQPVKVINKFLFIVDVFLSFLKFIFGLLILHAVRLMCINSGSLVDLPMFCGYVLVEIAPPHELSHVRASISLKLS